MTTRTPDHPCLPPQALDAEAALLGAILLDNRVLELAGEYLTADDFYLRRHQLVFRAMQALAKAEESLDHVSLSDWLRQAGHLDQVGGVAEIAALLEAAPSTANVRTHAKLVREKAMLRELIGVGHELEAHGYQADRPATELVDRAEQRLFRLSQGLTTGGFRPVGSLLESGVEWVSQQYAKPDGLVGVGSGFAQLDALTAGWQPGDLIIVGARPSMGKTSLALAFALHAAVQAQVGVGIFSLEMSAEQLVLRMLGIEGQIDAHALRRGRLTTEEWRRLTAACGRLEHAPVFLDDSAQVGLLQVRARARRLMAEQPIGLLIVDYLQLLDGPRGAESRQQEVSALSRAFKLLAKELRVPVIVLSQLSREVERRTDKRPILADLRESGAIEQDADLVLFLYRDEVYHADSPDRGTAELLVRKHRNGPIGDLRLVFLERFTKFAELEPEQGALL